MFCFSLEALSLSLTTVFFVLFSLCFSASLCLSCTKSLSLPQEFFRNLSHWIDQHAAMNDAGNFLIETCDDTVSLDLKQQLLILNERWRDLFLKVKQVTNKIKNIHLGQPSNHDNNNNNNNLLFPLMQYASVNELDKWRKDHLKAVSAMKDLLDTAELKLNAPVQVSFLNLRAFLSDVEVRKLT